MKKIKINKESLWKTMIYLEKKDAVAREDLAEPTIEDYYKAALIVFDEMYFNWDTSYTSIVRKQIRKEGGYII